MSNLVFGKFLTRLISAVFFSDEGSLSFLRDRLVAQNRTEGLVRVLREVTLYKSIILIYLKTYLPKRYFLSVGGMTILSLREARSDVRTERVQGLQSRCA